ncbi:hypothetical protein DPMN_107619 [Dreissena polymorpha]|uniref:Uncharacterized protein n=1 Tax=Dreissena polymorpha TaxID=45954 RepID=A0A9D4QKC4_DREPO|nr:hypothetical protein DPMN_107619 [Dreissena polymorpha]
MDFHPQKCSVLRVTRATSNLIQSEYILKGIKLSIDKTTKYLGVDLDSELSWRHLYDGVTNKAKIACLVSCVGISETPLNKPRQMLTSH